MKRLDIRGLHPDAHDHLVVHIGRGADLVARGAVVAAGLRTMKASSRLSPDASGASASQSGSSAISATAAHGADAAEPIQHRLAYEDSACPGCGVHGMTMADVARIQRRAMAVLIGTQAAAGVGVAAGIAVSNLVAAELSGSDVIGGAASTAMVVGAAGASAVLARVADQHGRRPALVTGHLTSGIGAVGAAAAVGLGSWVALLGALVLFGASIATGLATRFAATDLADPRRVGRELALVLWAVTVGVLAGPNLAEPARAWASALGLAAPTGPYLLCAAAFALALVGTLVGLRPDPLLLARERSTRDHAPDTGPRIPAWRVLRTAPTARLAVAGIALCNLVMVGLMSLTPLHMSHGGASLRLVGLVISVHIAGMYVLSPAFGVLADRIGRRRVLAVGAALLVVAGASAAAAEGSAAGQLAGALVLLGLGWSAGLVGGSALLVDAVAPMDRPGVQGLSDVTMNAAGALGGVLAGVTVAAWSYALLGLAVAALAALFLLAALLAARRTSTS